MWETPPSARWADIRMPVLFLMASEWMRDTVDTAVTVLPDAKAVWFNRADHDLHAQKPDEVSEHLVTLLERAQQ
jgi:pimeloyl-ACP methyl ester carboxylesterase